MHRVILANEDRRLLIDSPALNVIDRIRAGERQKTGGIAITISS